MGKSTEDTLLECVSEYMSILFELREVGADLQALSQGTKFSKSIQNFNEIVRQYQTEIIRPFVLDRQKGLPTDNPFRV